MGKGHGFEFQLLQDNKIWVLTSFSLGHKPVSYKWVFEFKYINVEGLFWWLRSFHKLKISISMKLSPCHKHKNYECNVIKKIKINMN